MHSYQNPTDFQFQLSVCICTRNRPEDLTKALKSVERSTHAALEVIVSDDSTNDESKILVTTHFPKVKYIEGPRKGLGANRNNALEAVHGTHVLFIDDDVIIDESFVELIYHRLIKISQTEPVDKLIISGIERKNGELVYPGEQCFLGYQNVLYEAGDEIRTVVMNGAVFPILVFKQVLFDEKLVYGNEEVDFTTRATHQGFKIVLYPEAVNFHYPSETNRDYYEPYHDSTRIYVTFKRYFSTESNQMKGLIYLLYAYLYAAARNFKYQGVGSVPNTFDTLRRSIGFITDEFSTASRKTRV